MEFINAQKIMQRAMNTILEDLKVNGAEVYTDDIVIHERTKMNMTKKISH